MLDAIGAISHPLVSDQYGKSTKSKEAVVDPDIDLQNDLAGVAEILRRSKCLVSVSTAVVHIAALYGIPVVLLVPKAGVGRLWYWYNTVNNRRSFWYPNVLIVEFERSHEGILFSENVGELIERIVNDD